MVVVGSKAMASYTDADDENMEEIFEYMDQQNANHPRDDDSFDIISQAEELDAAAAAAAPTFVPGQPVQVATPAATADMTGAADAGAESRGPEPTAVAALIVAELKSIQEGEGGLDLSFNGRVKLFPRLESCVEAVYGTDVFWKKFLGMQLRPFVAETLRQQEKAGTVVERVPQPAAAAAAVGSGSGGGGGGGGGSSGLSVGAREWTPSFAAAPFVPQTAPPAPAAASAFTAAETPPPPSPTARQIFTRNLNPESDETRIEAFFSQFGLVESVQILRARGTGLSRGMANITFSQQADAIKALEKSSYYIDDRMVYCEWSKAR